MCGRARGAALYTCAAAGEPRGTVPLPRPAGRCHLHHLRGTSPCGGQVIPPGISLSDAFTCPSTCKAFGAGKPLRARMSVSNRVGVLSLAPHRRPPHRARGQRAGRTLPRDSPPPGLGIACLAETLMPPRGTACFTSGEQSASGGLQPQPSVPSESFAPPQLSWPALKAARRRALLCWQSPKRCWVYLLPRGAWPAAWPEPPDFICSDGRSNAGAKADTPSATSAARLAGDPGQGSPCSVCTFPLSL